MKGFIQVIAPDPEVPCTPGWCLTYLDDSFDLEAHGKQRNYPTATAAWEASRYKHQDQDFPEGCWVPVWFSLKDVAAGHVALRAPDGSIWSSSHPTSNKPVRHASLDALYKYYGPGRLSYLGWTEDLTDILVIKKGGEMANITRPEAEELKYLMRILNSEVAGWDYMPVHTGKKDAAEVDYMASMGLTTAGAVARRAQDKWEEGVAFRALKDKWRAAYSAQPGLLKQIDDLKKQLAEAQAGKTAPATATTDADKKLQAIKDALDIK